MPTTLLRITPELEPAVPLITQLPVPADGDDRELTFLLPDTSDADRRRRRKNMLSSVAIDAGIWILFIYLLTLTPAVQRRIFNVQPIYAPVEHAKVEPLRPQPTILHHVTVLREHSVVKTPPPDVPFTPPKIVAPPVAPKPKALVAREVFKPVEVMTPTIAPPKPKHIAGFDADVAPSVPGDEGRAKVAPKLGAFGYQTAAAAPAVRGAKTNVGAFGSANAYGGNDPNGGARIGKKLVEGTGFGSAGVGSGSGYAGYGSQQHHAVATTAFDAPAAATPATRARNSVVAAVARTKPPEILEKPKPAYTEAALKARIEGEVVLRVILGATGDVRVLGVVQGLGYGLEETAKDAARRIKFKPAMQDGQPVDYTAILHITYSLAY
jgi:TonB family protein